MEKFKREIQGRLLEALMMQKMNFDAQFAQEMELYRNILENYRSVALELKLSSVLELSYYLTYLLWNGYFSFNKTHHYDTNKRVKILPFLAGGIFTGKGACLEHSALLRDFLKIYDKEALIVNCFVPVSIDWLIGAKTSLLEMLYSAVGLVQKIGNHAVVIINEGSQQYVFDPTNLCILNTVDNFRASLINGEKVFDLKNCVLEFLNLADIKSELFRMLKEETVRSNLTREEIAEVYFETMDKIKGNIDLLDEGYDIVRPSISHINSRILAMKRL